MTIQEAHKNLTRQLLQLYDEREAVNIAQLVTESITGFKNSHRIINKDAVLTDKQYALYQDYEDQLMQMKPVQYVLQQSWFAGMKLFVNEYVLIPRPETEELVEWVKEDYKDHSSLAIIDIGTGSGSIALALKKGIPFCNITAIDVSNDALSVAQKNATDNQLDIHFFQLDILEKISWEDHAEYDVIISNPPYILESEAAQMADIVLNYEPHRALFVPDTDALLFYKSIADFATRCLKNDGALYFEINEMMASEVTDVLKTYGFNAVELREDMQGKNRMIKAQRS